MYSVTPILHWRQASIRGETVTIEVREPPPDSVEALGELQKLAASGVWMEVQSTALHDLEHLEEVALFAERHPYSIHGAQARLGVAFRLIELVPGHGGTPALRDGRRTWSERMHVLLSNQPTCDHNLPRTWSRLRDELSAAEKRFGTSTPR